MFRAKGILELMKGYFSDIMDGISQEDFQAKTHLEDETVEAIYRMYMQYDKYLKMSDFGESVESGILTLKCRKKQEKESAEKIEEAKKHNIFFDRQKEWQLYCEYCKKTYGKMLEKEGEEFWKKYFEWCEITDEEREKVDELRKELGV